MATATLPRGKTKPDPKSKPPATGWTAELHEIPLAAIELGDNVRATLGDVGGLTDSIRAVGVLEPVRVREIGAGKYLLLFGHRRLAAAREAGLATIPAVVEVEAETAAQRSTRQLIENIQREDLNPLEEAKAYRAILDADPKLTQAELAKQVGRAAPTISNSLRLLELDPKVLPMVAAGKLTGAHAKALAGLKGREQVELAEWAAGGAASAHALEQQVRFRREQADREAKDRAARRKIADAVEKELEKAGARKESSTLVAAGYYAIELVKILKGRGWQGTSGGHERGSTCDCEAFAVDTTWDGKLRRVTKTCVDEGHRKIAQQEHDAAWKAKQERDAAKRAADAAELERRAVPLAAYLAKSTPAGERLVLFALLNEYHARARFAARRNAAIGWEEPDADLWRAILKIKAAELGDEVRRVVADAVLHAPQRAGILEALEQIPEALPAEPKAKGTKAAAK